MATTVSLRGVPVEFPKEPYDCQVNYMGKVIEALSNGQNALLESPTGTGKTLALLCSTLAWQKKHLRAREPEVPTERANPPSANALKGPQAAATVGDSSGVIIYATRTHSQLEQVIGEMKNTIYRPKMAVLGSREQLCIHEKVSKLKGAQLNHACQMLNAKRGCRYKNNMDGMTEGGAAHVATNEIADIEDLALMGRKKMICPYYYSRDTSASADIVFMPYNYLLDSSIRKTIKIGLQNAVVIFDEAHNLEQVASDAAGCSFSSTDIAACIQELQQALVMLKDDSAMRKDEKPSRAEMSGLGSSGGTQKPSMECTVELLKAMFELEKVMDKIPLVQNKATSADCAIMPGGWLVNALINAGFRSDMLLEELRRCGNMIMEAANDALNSNVGGSSSSMPAPEPKLSSFTTALERILYTGRAEHQDFRVYVAEEANKSKKTNQGQIVQYYNNSSVGKKRVINFWCFCTGVALKELKDQGVRSLVLTSGTLSPMEAMKEDLRIPFAIELQNPHVIKANQVFISAVSKGSSQKSLNSTFMNRDTISYKDELGQTILEISCTLLGEHGCITNAPGSGLMLTAPELSSIRGGVLVFFPSYGLLDAALERWKATGLFQKIAQIAGAVVVETKAKSAKPADAQTSFNNSTTEQAFGVITGKKGKSLEGADGQDENVLGLVAEFESAIASKGSCILFGVCRGKVAEGVDFSDNNGRIVIVTGIPFAPLADPWIVLKKQYLDDKLAQSRASAYAPAVQASSSSHPPHNSMYVNDPSVYASMASLAAPVANSTLVTLPPTTGNLWATARQAFTEPPLVSQQVALYQAYCANVPSGSGPSGMFALTVPPTAQRSPAHGAGLNGQMWYQQAASRAVNQCLGRVIRHKNDWGAIFLLDERFLVDKQVNQLSSWMRPMVKRCGFLRDAMAHFRPFLQNIARNASLRPQVQFPLEVSLPANARPRAAISIPQVVQPVDPFARFIEISESALPSVDEPASYIQQDLLMSQNRTAQQFNAKGALDIDALIASQPSISRVQTKPAVAGGDFKSRLDSLNSRKVEEKPKPRDMAGAILSYPRHFNSNYPALKDVSSMLTQETQVLDDVDERCDNSSQSFGLQYSQNTSFTQASARSIDSENENFSQAAPIMPSNSQIKYPASVAASSQDMRAKLSSLSSQHRTASSATVSSVDIVKHLIGKWKEKLDQKQLGSLKGLFVKIKKEGLQHPTQMKGFQEQFLDIVDDALSLEEQTAALKSLAVLVGSESDDADDRKEIFLQLVTQRYQRMFRKRRIEEQDAKEEEEDKKRAMPPPGSSVNPNATVSSSSASRASSSQSTMPSDDSKLNTNALGSKRAKQLLQMTSASAVTVSAPAAKNNSFLSRLQSISSMEMSHQSTGNSLLDRTSKPAVTKKLLCIVCKDVATLPCAAKCGHVCCQKCWMQWLKVKATCPLCREPASQQSITHIVVTK